MGTKILCGYASWVHSRPYLQPQSLTPPIHMSIVEARATADRRLGNISHLRPTRCTQSRKNPLLHLPLNQLPGSRCIRIRAPHIPAPPKPISHHARPIRKFTASPLRALESQVFPPLEAGNKAAHPAPRIRTKSLNAHAELATSHAYPPSSHPCNVRQPQLMHTRPACVNIHISIAPNEPPQSSSP